MADPMSLAPLPVAGVRLGTVCAGIRYADRPDLVLLEIMPTSRCAAVFTRNAFCAAPVTVARHHLSRSMPRYLVINAGNANAGTGRSGLADAKATCTALAELTGCSREAVLPFSTGVIGEPLPVARILAGLPKALADLRPEGWLTAAKGIMTTDTRPKVVSKRVICGDRVVTITGMAKGAGMIRPDMATMLAFIATDAGVEKDLLQRCLREIVGDSFNAITVDGDTSTNDACVLLTTDQAGLRITAGDTSYGNFKASLSAVAIELAQAIVRDGEGATKFITIQVEQGHNVAECRQVAYTIAHSPLVKTAFFASDPNWGRLLAAIGRSGLRALRSEDIVIYLDELCIVRNGSRSMEYSEAKGQQVMARNDITVRVQLGRGGATARIWTTDLSYDYVRINADYRS
jgi:glutamate N-acetyltransferase/amino-acid N-acetyltransferase